MSTRTPRPLLNAALAALFALGLAACENTIEGAGDDIEEMGDEIDDEIDEAT